MNHAAGARSLAKFQSAVTVSQTFTHEVDTLGYKYASIDVIFTPYTASNVSLANILRITEGDTTGQATTNVSGLVGGTDFTIAATGASTGANVGGIARFNIDTRGRRRFLQVNVTPSTTVSVITDVRLSKGEVHASSTSDSGCNQYVNV